MRDSWGRSLAWPARFFGTQPRRSSRAGVPATRLQFMPTGSDNSSILTAQEMHHRLGDVYNRSAKLGMVTPELLKEIIEEIMAWRAAIRHGDVNEEIQSKETFRALATCLQRGRHYKDDQGRLIDTLPLGRPRLEDQLW